MTTTSHVSDPTDPLLSVTTGRREPASSAPGGSLFEPVAAPPVRIREMTVQEDGRDWQALPGGELEAPRPKALCRSCRERLRESVARGVWPERSKTLCFGCYRTQLDRDRRIKAAAELNTASEARFQTSLPIEPVNRARLQQLRAARQVAREAELRGTGRYVDKRRRAQIAARHALQRLAEGLKARGIQLPAPPTRTAATPARVAGDLRLPDAWLPFVSGGTSK